MTRLILLAARLGLCESRVRDPYDLVLRAGDHLCGEYFTSAAVRERGYLTAPQQEAIEILSRARKQLIGSTRRIVL